MYIIDGDGDPDPESGSVIVSFTSSADKISDFIVDIHCGLESWLSVLVTGAGLLWLLFEADQWLPSPGVEVVGLVLEAGLDQGLVSPSKPSSVWG
jgi:hypothetical protein